MLAKLIQSTKKHIIKHFPLTVNLSLLLYQFSEDEVSLPTQLYCLYLIYKYVYTLIGLLQIDAVRAHGLNLTAQLARSGFINQKCGHAEASVEVW